MFNHKKFLLLIIFIPNLLYCQTKKHSPKTATIMSAIIPGLGQIYNKKYWKLPIIYSGLAIAGYFVYTNQTQFKLYTDAYVKRFDDDPSNDTLTYFSTNNLLTISEYYRRNRDISIIVTAAIYVLNIIDADVDAHLFSFDVSNDLSFKINPVITPTEKQLLLTVNF